MNELISKQMNEAGSMFFMISSVKRTVLQNLKIKIRVVIDQEKLIQFKNVLKYKNWFTHIGIHILVIYEILWFGP